MEMICSCCGEEKNTTGFSYGRQGWTKYCKVCGEWLKLFKARFDASFWLDDKKTRKSMEALRKEAKVDTVVSLYGAFGIQFPVEQQTVEVRTVLANAPWPYREAA